MEASLIDVIIHTVYRVSGIAVQDNAHILNLYFSIKTNALTTHLKLLEETILMSENSSS